MSRQNLRLAFWLWLTQFFVALCCAFFDWTHLSLWDSRWYRHIVDNGYSATLSPPPDQGVGNVGFFPGYPLMGWIFKNLFQVSTDAGLLIASSLATLFAWFYFAEYLDWRRDSSKASNILWVLLFPFIFFFVAAYSDSLGVATILGYILFTEKWLATQKESDASQSARAPLWFALAAFHGFGMTFTRVMNILLVLYPLVRALQLRVSKSTLIKSTMLVLIAAFGTLSFFIYCHYKFGAWNFYFITERVIWGWAGEIQWHKLFPPTELFDFSRPTRGDTVGRYVTIIFGVLFGFLLNDIIRRKRYREPIAALFLLGGMFWGAYVVGKTTWGFTGMGRYLIPLVLIFIPDFHLPVLQEFKSLQGWRRYTWGFLVFAMLVLQIFYTLKFARNGWVA